MPECPVCRREFDARFQVFAAPSRESYDTVDCARRAARSDGAAQAILAPTLLPTIELLPLVRSTAAAAPAALLVASRRRLAAAVAIPLVASPAAVAAGLSLVAVGTATSLALWSPSLDGNGKPTISAAASATTSPSWDVAPPAPSSESGAEGMQRSARGAPAADQGASKGEGLISFVESGAPELPQLGGDSDLGTEEPPPEVPSSAPPSHTTPPPETKPHLSPGPLSGGEPVRPAAPKPPVGPLSPPVPGNSPSSSESEPPPPPSDVQPSPPPAPRPPTSPPLTPEPKLRKKPENHKDKDKLGATPAVTAIPADGKTRRDEPKPRRSPPATPAVPAKPPSRGEIEPQPETGAGGSAEAPDSEEPGGGSGHGNEKDNGQGKGNGKHP
jgi:hypothetical protein